MATASPRRKRGHDRGTGHDESDAEDADAWEYENGAGSSSSFQRAGSLPDARLDATIKLFVTHTEPHYSLPWQMRRQTSSTSTGFVIEGKRILTNAHCVDNFAVVKVKKRASSTKYVAEVIAIGRECDLALLTVADPEFWQHITPIKLAQRLPTLQDEVTVVGFPVGGDNLAITQGVVSRIDMQEYVHGCCELLAVQIDAAINPGNSGGPAFGGEDHECVGIAFQSLKDGQTENIGYIIPTEVADHFLTDVKQGHYKGFVELGLELQRCENPTLRVHAGLKPKQSGLLVKMVHPTSGAAESDVRRGDVVTHIDNVPLANDGTVPFRAGGGRIAFSYLLSQRYVGESSTMKILRGGNALPPKKVPLRVHSLLVPESSEHRKTGVRCPDLRLPSYLIIGGVVFTPLCEPYLRSEYGDDFDQKAPIKLLDRWQYGIKESADAQVVVLSQVREWEGARLLTQPYTPSPPFYSHIFSLPLSLVQVLAHPSNVGYEHLTNHIVLRVNGSPLTSLKQLVELLDHPSPDMSHLIFELEPHDERVVLDATSVKEVTAELLHLHQIPSDRSVDLRVGGESSAAAAASSKGKAKRGRS